MTEKAHDLFDKLMTQVQLDDTAEERPLIQNGRIDKVIVHQQSRLWGFHLNFDELMPVMLYQTFMQQLELAFQQIVQASVQITINQTAFTEEQSMDYWQLVLLNSQCNMSLVQKVLKTQTPQFGDRKIILSIDNEVVIPYLKQQHLPIIEELYFPYGSPKPHTEPKMDQQQVAEVLKKFEEQRLEQAVIFQQQAVESLAKREQTKKEKQQQAPAFDGPIRLDRNIPSDEPIMPMGNILEEERRIATESSIFDKEACELCSKRKILILKITDYISSLAVKKFSNGEKDGQVSDAI